MADRRLTPQVVNRTGLAATYVADLLTADTHQVNNDGSVFFHFKKTGAGACTVTFITHGSIDGLTIADRTVTVPATTGDVFVGPFQPTVYNEPGTNDMEFTVSEVTGLSCAILHLG